MLTIAALDLPRARISAARRRRSVASRSLQGAAPGRQHEGPVGGEDLARLGVAIREFGPECLSIGQVDDVAGLHEASVVVVLQEQERPAGAELGGPPLGGRDWVSDRPRCRCIPEANDRPVALMLDGGDHPSVVAGRRRVDLRAIAPAVADRRAERLAGLDVEEADRSS